MYNLVSDATASRIRDLIGDTGQGVGNVASGSAHRQVAFVKCVSWDTGTHTGTGQVAQRDSSGWSFMGTSGDMLLLADNGQDLTVNKRYLALRFGKSGSADIFVAVGTDVALPEFGCGLVQDEDGVWTFDNTIAGTGIKKQAEEDGCGFYLEAGCAITLGDDKIAVRVEDLPDETKGIEAIGEGTCKKLGIKQGCGITLDSEGGITVFSPDVAGHGLEPGASPCELAVKTGCGITLDATYGVTVFSPDIAGYGLQPGATPCELEVKAGCGITVDATGVKVNTSALAGPGLVPSSPCGLAVNPGCGIRVEDDEVKFHNVIVGQGLRKDANGCDFDIDPGCHITLEGGAKIGVDVSGMIRDGLALDETGDCDGIKVKAACGIYVDEDGVAVKNMDLAGDCLIPDPTTCLLHVDLEPDDEQEVTYTTVTAHSLTASGCSVSLQTTTQTVTVKKNLCGLVVDVVLGTPTTSTQTVTTDPNACINWGEICDYCVGYGEYGGGDPVTPGYCYEPTTKTWVVCETIG